MPISATSFDERLARVEKLRHLPNRGQQVEEIPKVVIKEPFNPLSIILGVPLGVVFGAGSILIGGIVNVALINDGVTAETILPPGLSMITFGFLFFFYFFLENVLNYGKWASRALILSFIAMWRGEFLLYERFPELWVTIYDAQYLPEVIRTIGDVAS